MIEASVEQWIDKVQYNREKLSSLLESMASDQDWQPGPDEWSFRFLAAHLETVDKECYLDRVIRIAAGENPHFASYFNTGRDFSRIDLEEALREWSVTRQEIVDFVRDLPEEKLRLTGSHTFFGTINVLDVLKSMDEHDSEHLRDLERVLEDYRAKTHGIMKQ
jgi:hypothetical protein